MPALLPNSGTSDAAGPITRADGLTWLKQAAWPLWLEFGVDWERRAFHEQIDPRTLRCAADYRRLRVAARQTYAFSVAATFGVERAREATMIGIDFLLTHARQSDGGYAWRFDLDNRPIDQRRDLYDHAFVLLAFASASLVEQAEMRRRDALDVLAFIDEHLIHPTGGYEESLPRSRPRRQNPHMHLLEALLASHETFGDELFLTRASGLVDLFLDRLFQQPEGALPEVFDDELQPVRHNGRYISEPGHHFEWVWLLRRYLRLMDRAGRKARNGQVTQAGADLLAFAERYGLNARGLVVDEVWSDGATKTETTRLWPQTERIKALVETSSASASGGFEPLWPYLAGVRPGLWHERLQAGGMPAQQPAPASSLYHLTCALAAPATLVR